MSKEPVQCWKSSDGQVHDTLGDARTREYQLEAIQVITKMLAKSDNFNENTAEDVAKFLIETEDGLQISKIVTALEGQ